MAIVRDSHLVGQRLRLLCHWQGNCTVEQSTYDPAAMVWFGHERVTFGVNDRAGAEVEYNRRLILLQAMQALGVK